MSKYNRKVFQDDDGSVWETWTDKSGSVTRGVELSSGLDDDDGEPGCAACGNPAYPNCKSSCPMFDD